MTDFFPVEDFDGWAESYDQAVLDESRFPFAGYQAALNKVVELADTQPGMSVLDLGTGTGNLALPFAEMGCELWCTDFAPSMLEKARQKLPKAQIIQFDLRDSWPSKLNRRFDRIVSAYVFHHFKLEDKVRLIEKLVRHQLASDGWIVMADISFPNQQALDAVKLDVGDDWEEEFYWLADEVILAFEKVGFTAEFHQISFCGGVYVIR